MTSPLDAEVVTLKAPRHDDFICAPLLPFDDMLDRTEDAARLAAYLLSIGDVEKATRVAGDFRVMDDFVNVVRGVWVAAMGAWLDLRGVTDIRRDLASAVERTRRSQLRVVRS